MKSQLVIVLSLVAALAAGDSDENPFDFLFSRCEDQEGSGGVGGCVRELMQTALERDRPRFSTGLRVGNKTLVLEPLQLGKLDKLPSQGRSSKARVTEAQLSGLSEVQLESVMLTNTTAAAVVQFPALAAEARGKVKYGFLPLSPHVQVRLEQPRLMVGAGWSAPDGQLQLHEPHAKLWLDGYDITINGLTSMGRNVAKALNDNKEGIIEFMTPSLEAAVVRALKKLDQEERNAALRWLEKTLS